jgi:hypothetical protein
MEGGKNAMQRRCPDSVCRLLSLVRSADAGHERFTRVSIRRMDMRDFDAAQKPPEGMYDLLQRFE